MSKASNRVEFHHGDYEKMGLNNQWLEWMYGCICAYQQ